MVSKKGEINSSKNLINHFDSLLEYISYPGRKTPNI